MFIKAWSNSDDPECLTEKLAYESLQAPYLISGVPAVLKNARDDECGVFAIVLQRLGPTLDDLLQMLPDHKFDERMVLSVAIQMVSLSSLVVPLISSIQILKSSSLTIQFSSFCVLAAGPI